MNVVGLTQTLNIEEAVEDVTIAGSLKQQVIIKAPVGSIRLSGCSEIAVTVNAAVKVVEMVHCQKIEVSAEAAIGKVILEKCEFTELHFNKENLFESIQTKETKGTTVCLPDACNMIPANKEGKIITATPASGGLQFA
jgi:hypothetical protein